MGPSLYYIDYIATLQKVDKAVFGYGSYFSLAMMGRHYRSNMSLEEAIDMVDKCIMEIRSRLVVAPPNFVIKIVDQDGAREYAWRESIKFAASVSYNMAAVVLDAKQLRTLAKVIYYTEVEAIRDIPFKSEPDRAAYLKDCKENYEAGLALLDSGDQLKREFQADEVKTRVAHEIYSYLQMGVNSLLQSIRNYRIRMSYITKIKDYADDMMKSLRTLDGADVAAVEKLAESATAFKNFMLEYHRTMQSPLSQAFSRMLHQSGTTYQQLLTKYAAKLKFKGPYRNLSDNEKVLESIIKASGHESSLGNLISKVLGRAGIVFLVFTAGIMVWDIFSSENKVETAVSNIIQTGAAVGGAMLGQAIGVAVAEMLTESAACALMAGIVTGIGAAVVLGLFASWFVEAFLTSGGYPVIVTTDLHYYVAQTPDCAAFAREIKYRSH